jgi:hypothetical protein
MTWCELVYLCMCVYTHTSNVYDFATVGYGGHFPRGLSSRSVKLISHVLLVPRSRTLLYGMVPSEAQGQINLYVT